MIAQVRPGDLADWLDGMRAHGEPVVLDVREPGELRSASVKAAADRLRCAGRMPPVRARIPWTDVCARLNS